MTTPPMILTAEFSDGTVYTKEKWGDSNHFASRNGRGKIRLHSTRKQAERAAGARAEVVEVTYDRAAFDEWFGPPRTQRQFIDADYHSGECSITHQTYRGLARCRWPNNIKITGDGRYVVLIEHDHRYGGFGPPAYWPDLRLFPTEAEAIEFFEHGVSAARGIRLYVFPGQPQDAEPNPDGFAYTQEGNRLRYPG